MIRVFTQSEERTAPEDVIAAYDEGVASSAIPGQIGDVKVDSLPGVEALFNPGEWHSVALRDHVVQFHCPLPVFQLGIFLMVLRPARTVLRPNSLVPCPIYIAPCPN